MNPNKDLYHIRGKISKGQVGIEIFFAQELILDSWTIHVSGSDQKSLILLRYNNIIQELENKPSELHALVSRLYFYHQILKITQSCTEIWTLFIATHRFMREVIGGQTPEKMTALQKLIQLIEDHIPKVRAALLTFSALKAQTTQQMFLQKLEEIEAFYKQTPMLYHESLVIEPLIGKTREIPHYLSEIVRRRQESIDQFILHGTQLVQIFYHTVETFWHIWYWKYIRYHPTELKWVDSAIKNRFHPQLQILSPFPFSYSIDLYALTPPELSWYYTAVIPSDTEQYDKLVTALDRYDRNIQTLERRDVWYHRHRIVSPTTWAHVSCYYDYSEIFHKIDWEAFYATPHTVYEIQFRNIYKKSYIIGMFRQNPRPPKKIVPNLYASSHAIDLPDNVYRLDEFSFTSQDDLRQLLNLMKQKDNPKCTVKQGIIYIETDTHPDLVELSFNICDFGIIGIRIMTGLSEPSLISMKKKHNVLLELLGKAQDTPLLTFVPQNIFFPTAKLAVCIDHPSPLSDPTPYSEFLFHALYTYFIIEGRAAKTTAELLRVWTWSSDKEKDMKHKMAFCLTDITWPTCLLCWYIQHVKFSMFKTLANTLGQGYQEPFMKLLNMSPLTNGDPLLWDPVNHFPRWPVQKTVLQQMISRVNPLPCDDFKRVSTRHHMFKTPFDVAVSDWVDVGFEPSNPSVLNLYHRCFLGFEEEGKPLTPLALVSESSHPDLHMLWRSMIGSHSYTVTPHLVSLLEDDFIFFLEKDDCYIVYYIGQLRLYQKIYKLIQKDGQLYFSKRSNTFGFHACLPPHWETFTDLYVYNIRRQEISKVVHPICPSKLLPVFYFNQGSTWIIFTHDWVQRGKKTQAFKELNSPLDRLIPGIWKVPKPSVSSRPHCLTKTK